MTRVFWKVGPALCCMIADTDDAEFARYYIDGLVVREGRTACLAVVS